MAQPNEVAAGDRRQPDGIRGRSTATPPAPEPCTSPARKIIHIDMDAFYASVEQRDDPSLRGRPVAVGGSRERGVVAAASYEARAFGVRSAMPSVTARRKCPDLVFVKPRFEVYKAISSEIRAVFAEHTPIIEPLSLDEAYLDVTENLQGIASATVIAEDIRARIRQRTGLTASAGVSYNKFLAKLASDHRKPDGLFVITPSMGAGFVETLTVGRFHGVGPATAAKMERLGIRTGADLRACTLAFLREHFGKIGPYYFGISRGIDERPVRADRIRKSVGAENTFSADLFETEAMREALEPILDKVWRYCEGSGLRGRTVTLKIKDADFHQITRSQSVVLPVANRAELEQIAIRLLHERPPNPRGIRLLGVTLSALVDAAESRTANDVQFALPF
ncbi:DNA polymerase IV [Aureimonas sp. AU20]|uniref:DNA polymerase IV n=2 Tax=Aureimonas sp. AU20 TaxID=1349819 RepID=UPI0009E83EC1|nr:DNA polymerase IV [Aureimonas sp. AU20]